MYDLNKNNLIIALGDPSGIGMEITLKALGAKQFPKEINPILVGCKSCLFKTYKNLVAKGIKSIPNPKTLNIEDLPLAEVSKPGFVNEKTGHASFQWLTKAAKMVIAGKGKALVTAPIAKHAWHAYGHNYSGQTERLAEITNTKNPSMLFTALSPHNGWRLNTLLATTHIPLKQVQQELNPKLIEEKLNTLLNFCLKYKPNPKIAIAGLNPHAGEKGFLGKEEQNWLIPCLNDWQKSNSQINLIGPLPPDTCWISAAKAWQGSPNNEPPDGILALYHDQGLIPVKLIAFERAVNTTLGLPFIRTSPDHGTACDIAGQGCANSESMLSAIQTAWELS